MFENILNQLITVGAGLAILGGSYLVWLLSGIANVIFTEGRKWNWKRMLEDLVKTILMCVAILSWVVVFNALDWFSTNMGADITKILEGASVTGLVGGIIGGTAYFILKAYKNFYEFVNTNHVEVEVTQPNYKNVANTIKAWFVRHDSGTGETIDATTSTPEMGSFPYYYVNIATPTDFYNAVNGVGFNEGYGYQCVAGFKEFMYALCGKIVATNDGCASGYANQIAQVEELGFKWHDGTQGLQNGDWAIFGGSTWGHVAMYYNGQWFGQNQNAADPYVGNPFNLDNMSTASIIGYYRPNIYNQPAPTPIQPTEDKVSYTYKEGDTFGQVILNLGLGTSHGLWGADGDVAYYTEQLHEQGIYGNIPIGTTITLTRRK